MLDSARTFAVDSRKVHADLYTELNVLREAVLKCADVNEIADAAYVLRETEKFFKDLEKEARLLREHIERMACIIWVQAGDPAPIRTEYCSAKPDVKMMVSLPKRKQDPAGYAELMTGLGIPRGLWDIPSEQHAPIEPHWPGMIDYVSSLMEQGKPLPGGLDPTKTYSIYKLQITRRKEVT
jgi:hypothetical protein